VCSVSIIERRAEASTTYAAKNGNFVLVFIVIT
jgi:hypothetical protein